MLPPSLAPLAAWPQFVAWRVEMRANAKGEQVTTKVPYSPTSGKGASSADPSHWSTYDKALEYQRMAGMDGVGFVFSERDPFFFIDIDKALTNGQWSQLAQELCARFAGAAVEVSQSGTGLHIIGTCTKGFEHKNKNIPLKLELYTKERFVALTGTHATGSVSAQMDGALGPAVVQFFTRSTDDRMATEWTTEPRADWRGPEDDLELIDRMLKSGTNNAAAAFGAGGDKVKFHELWTADVRALGDRWPPNNPGDGFDHSNADQSLANLLAFWTGGNCDRIERLMRLSALARSKWDTHHTYLQTTILKAVGLVTKVYVERTPASAPQVPPPPPLEREQVEQAGFAPRTVSMDYLLSGHQLAHFEGCVYITSLNKVLTPRGDLLDQARFNVEYGGHEFVLSLDGKRTTTSAWTAFTENHNYAAPRADRICFRPEHGAGGIVVDSGKRLANTYFPAETDALEGDPSPFLNHIHKMLPHGRDADILLTYMASVVQNPGMKAQWWPVVQGAEGNFKSFLLTIMSHAVGSHYAHLPNMEKMIRAGSNFNGWIDRKLFLGLDEVYAANRREFFEGFKTTVTNRSVPIEGKGQEEVTGDNRANGMIVTNHQDGVPVIGRNRRYAAFFCAQQTPEDMLRDGMGPEYISHLKDWLLGAGAYLEYGANYGIRVVCWWLERKELAADIDPNQLAVRAPETSSTKAAMVAGRGKVEQEILEAIEEERPGFAGGWVSSIYLDRLLDAKRLSIPINKRRELMLTLGYDYHPALLGTSVPGRVTSTVGPDNGKPRLYVRTGSVPSQLTDPASVTKAYSDAQLRASGDRSQAGQAFK